MVLLQPNIILGGGSSNFQPCFRGGSVIFVPKGGGGHVFSINHISKCSGPPPPPILFDQSLTNTIFKGPLGELTEFIVCKREFYSLAPNRAKDPRF